MRMEYYNKDIIKDFFGLLQEENKTIEQKYEEVKALLEKEYTNHNFASVFEVKFQQRKLDILNDYANFLLDKIEKR